MYSFQIFNLATWQDFMGGHLLFRDMADWQMELNYNEKGHKITNLQHATG
jgi:hypothetical protein